MVYDSQTDTFSVHQGVLDRVKVEKEATALDIHREKNQLNILNLNLSLM